MVAPVFAVEDATKAETLSDTIFDAAGRGDLEGVRKHFAMGAVADATTGGMRWSPLLHAAVRGGNAEVVQLVLDHGASVDAPGSMGETALHWAAAQGRTEITEKLLKAGAAPDASDGSGWTPLQLAASNGQVEISRMLVEAGADVNRKGHWNKTPLQTAVQTPVIFRCRVSSFQGSGLWSPGCCFGQRCHARALPGGEGFLTGQRRRSQSGNGPDPGGQSRQCGPGGLSPEGRSRRRGPGPAAEHAPSSGREAGNEALVQSLLARGAVLEATNTTGDTPLLTAAQSGSDAVLKALLKSGAKVNAKNLKGQTALFIAAGRGKVEPVKTLLEAGADREAKEDESENTPLLNAILRKSPDVAGVLLERGADFRVKNVAGDNALMLAVKHGLKEVVEQLHAKGCALNEPDKDEFCRFTMPRRGGTVRWSSIFWPIASAQRDRLRGTHATALRDGSRQG
jgi:ankyrin repeat protein